MIKVVGILLENGAEIEATNLDGWTPLMLAARVGHKDVTWWLQMITIIGA